MCPTVQTFAAVAGLSVAMTLAGSFAPLLRAVRTSPVTAMGAD